MTPERAQEIVAGICQRAFFAMGIQEKPMASLEGVSLAEMLEAKQIVEAKNREPVEGPRTLYVVPDDRLLAAVYTLENYQRSATIAAHPTSDRAARRVVVEERAILARGL